MFPSQVSSKVEEDKFYRTEFNRVLEPIKLMLLYRKNKLAYPEWLEFVEFTRLSVLSRPEEYLGRELPHHRTLVILVDAIFADFLRNEQHN